MLIIHAIHESGAPCAFDADNVFVYIALPEGAGTQIVSPTGTMVNLKNPTAGLLKAIEKANEERPEE